MCPATSSWTVTLCISQQRNSNIEPLPHILCHVLRIPVWQLVSCAGSMCRVNAETAYIISPAVGANFVMYIATMRANSSAGHPPTDVERCRLAR